MPDQKGKKLADALYGQPEEKAAFGVFPQMKPRRSKQDPEAAKDVPRQLLRGWAAGTLGLPGDIEGLIRMLPKLDETPRLPTSEFYLDYLPGKAEGESGKTAAAAGTLFGGLGSTKVARGALEAGKGAAKLAERAAAMPSPSGLAAQRGVVKLPDGNWMPRSVERGLAPLKANRPNADEELRKARELFTPEYKSGMSPEAVARLENETLPRLEKEVALNKWVDSNLTNYVKKKMATPEDPVRKLAEEGVLHIDPRISRVTEANAQLHRGNEGQVLGQSELAKKWEDLSDAAVGSARAGYYTEARPDVVENLPWIAKLDPNTPIYHGDVSDLGFDHIVDVLREDLAAGRIRPEQLNKVSMEQAVRRTYEYDQEMAKKMAEAKIKATEGMPVYKEYPEGYKWVELAKPTTLDKLPEGYEAVPYKGEYSSGIKIVDASGNQVSVGENLQDALKNWDELRLEEALKYEGETMGHCVGGYCPDVLEGRSRIFSLRDAKGEPHVTIEVQPGMRQDEAVQKARAEGLTGKEFAARVFDLVEGKGIPGSIAQIKGKQNLAPKEEYLPYVQDFVRGGQWSQVGDLRNTGLIDLSNRARAIGEITGNPNAAFTPPELIEAFKRIPEGTRYMTREEFEQLMKPPAEGMKRGGKVHISDNPDTMRLELAGGGAPKAIAQRLKTLREQLAERAAAAEAIQARDRKLPLEQIPEGSLTPEAIEAEIKRMREEKGMAAGGAAKALKALAKGAKEEEKAAIKASEALGQVEGRPLLITQTDRSKVGGKWLGGPGFSGLQHTRPEYKAAEAAWGVAQPATAKTILGGYQKAKKEFGAEPVMTTMLGTPTQHQSNKMVFEELHRLFKKSAKDGNLDPELLDKINTRLRMAEDKQGKPIFPEDVNILAPDFRKVANTFDRRAVASNLMGGMTVGGKKGQIIDYDEVIRHTTDPALLEAPSGALGNRMFTLSGGIVDRPDLHPAFPSILQGEDLNVMFSPVARELVMRDFIERTMREKGRTPGYMDYTRGYPPTQLITEELLTDLQKKGFAEGGAVSGISGDDLIIEERPL